MASRAGAQVTEVPGSHAVWSRLQRIGLAIVLAFMTLARVFVGFFALVLDSL